MIIDYVPDETNSPYIWWSLIWFVFWSLSKSILFNNNWINMLLWSNEWKVNQSISIIHCEQSSVFDLSVTSLSIYRVCIIVIDWCLLDFFLLNSYFVFSLTLFLSKKRTIWSSSLRWIQHRVNIHEPRISISQASFFCVKLT